MIITQEEFDRIKPVRGNCLVKLDSAMNDSIVLGKTGFKLQFPSELSDQTMCHVGISGTIVKQSEIINDMPWTVDIETTFGDRVFCQYKAVADALDMLANPCGQPGNPKWLKVEGKHDVYVWIHYKDLIIKQEGENIISLNGFILFESVEEEIKTNLLLPVHLKKKENTMFGRVVKTGSLIKDYGEEGRKYYCPDEDLVYEGDIIFFPKQFKVEVEYSLHQKLPKHLFRIQRRFILAIFNKDAYEKTQTRRIETKLSDIKYPGMI